MLVPMSLDRESTVHVQSPVGLCKQGCNKVVATLSDICHDM